MILGYVTTPLDDQRRRYEPEYLGDTLDNKHDGILSIYRLFGNGPPDWLEGVSKRPCKTAEQADHQREQTLKRFRKYGADDPEAARVANRLNDCRSGDDPCESGACPVCTRAFQRWLAPQMEGLVRQSGLSTDNDELVLVSIIPTRLPGKRSGTTSNPANALGRISKALKRADISFAVGGLDFSFNESDAGRGSHGASLREHLSVHGWILARADEVDRGRQSLRDSFPPVGSVKRPVKVYPFDGGLPGLAYAFKGDFTRRVTIPKLVDGRGQTLKRRNTRARPLRCHQTVRLMLLLDQLGLTARMILHGVTIDAGLHGPTLHLT